MLASKPWQPAPAANVFEGPIRLPHTIKPGMAGRRCSPSPACSHSNSEQVTRVETLSWPHAYGRGRPPAGERVAESLTGDGGSAGAAVPDARTGAGARCRGTPGRGSSPGDQDSQRPPRPEPGTGNFTADKPELMGK